jgi:hypothetical protein
LLSGASRLAVLESNESDPTHFEAKSISGENDASGNWTYMHQINIRKAHNHENPAAITKPQKDNVEITNFD